MDSTETWSLINFVNTDTMWPLKKLQMPVPIVTVDSPHVTAEKSCIAFVLVLEQDTNVDHGEERTDPKPRLHCVKAILN